LAPANTGGYNTTHHRIFVVEDSLVVGELIEIVLQDFGCVVLGPYTTLDAARNALQDVGSLSAALLDVNLKDGHIFPVAETLQRNGVPLVFLTGYDRAVLPPLFEDCPIIEKPFTLSDLSEAVRRILKDRNDS
jgi:DNA-binding response OmpR family regulator